MQITIDEAREYCRIDLTYDDALVVRLVNAAAAHVERITGWATTPQSYTKLIKNIRDTVRLPVWPVSAVTAIDVIGTTTRSVLSDFDVDLTERPARVTPLSQSFGLDTGETLRITYTAGETDAPDDMKQAVFMLVSHWYENREAVVVGTISAEVSLGVNQLLAPFIARRLA